MRQSYDRERSWQRYDEEDERSSRQSRGFGEERRGRERSGLDYDRGDTDFDRGRYQRGRGEFDQERGGFGQRRPSSPVGWTYTEVWLVAGPFTGRGPRGYQRSDERIREDVCERLTQHGQIDARDIDVEVSNGEVTLRGTVDSRQTKRDVEDTIDAVSGVKDIHNQLRLRQGQMETSAAGQGGLSSRLMPEDRAGSSGSSSLESSQTGTAQARSPQPVSAEGTRGRQFLERIHEGMDVCDRMENKIGSVSKVHQPAGVGAGSSGGRASGGAEAYLELDTGFLGLGKTLFVPANHVSDVREDKVILDVERERLDEMDWDKRPSFIQE
jgi:osmotically-inducible protein OsmY